MIKVLPFFPFEIFEVLITHYESKSELPQRLFGNFSVHFYGFKTRFLAKWKKGPKYCFDANANECKSTKSPFLQRSLCSVYLLAEHWEIESPLLVFPCKRRTKSDIQTNCQGLSGAHLSTKNTSFLQINSKWTTSVTFGLTFFCVGCFYF